MPCGWRGVWSVWLLLLGACVSFAPAPPTGDFAPMPFAWSGDRMAGASSPATSLSQWWRRFDDPLLVELIDDALRANPSVQGARSALLQARALAEVQSAGLGPALDASASAQRSHSDKGGYTNAFRAGFDASWEPDVFGGKRAAVAAADADTRASEASLGDVQVSVAAEVAIDYMQLRGWQARLAIAAANQASQQETLQITAWRSQAGLATALEVEQARAATAQTQASIPALNTALMQAEHSIAVLTGRAPASLHARLGIVTAAPTPAEGLVLDIPAETLRQRPDVRAAEARVSAAWSRVSQADAARFPGFQLSGSLGLSALTLGTLGQASSIVSALLGSVSVPLFDGGARRAQVRAQQAAFEQSRSVYAGVMLAALKEVEDSMVALSNDRERLSSLEIAADSAQRAALLARQRYASGLIDFQVVLETQRTALSTQDSLASTAADLNADHVRLYKALGGGWPASNAYTVTSEAPIQP